MIKFIPKSMKASTIFAVAITAITLTSIALGAKYGDLVAKGYRWVIADGLYACVSKDDVRRMVNHPTDEFNEFDLNGATARASL
jgi:hypothetical protein